MVPMSYRYEIDSIAFYGISIGKLSGMSIITLGITYLGPKVSINAAIHR